MAVNYDAVGMASNISGLAGSACGLLSLADCKEGRKGELSGGFFGALGGLASMTGGVADCVGCWGDLLSVESGKDKAGKKIVNSAGEKLYTEGNKKLSSQEANLRHGKRISGILGGTGGFLGTLGGASDMVGGIAKMVGGDTGKAISKWSGVASGILGGLGGLVGIGKGFADARVARKQQKIRERDLEIWDKTGREQRLAEQKKALETEKNNTSSQSKKKEIDAQIAKLDKENADLNTELIKRQNRKNELESKTTRSDAEEHELAVLTRQLDEKQIKDDIAEAKAKKGDGRIGMLSGLGSAIGGILGAFGSGFDISGLQIAGTLTGSLTGAASSSMGIVDGSLGLAGKQGIFGRGMGHFNLLGGI